MIETAPPIRILPFMYDDGGRAAAGFRGKTGDCAVRAAAVATGEPYKAIYNEFKRNRTATGQYAGPFAHGTQFFKLDTFLRKRGFSYYAIPYQKFDGSLPKGIVVASFRDHVTAVIDGVIHDTWRYPASATVIGYWIKEQHDD